MTLEVRAVSVRVSRFPAPLWRPKGVALARKIFLAVVCVCLIGACGHSPASSSISAASSAAQSQTGPAASQAATSQASAAPVSAPGCGVYCQQAGESAGSSPQGYPCPQNRCLSCPPQSCISLGSSGATAANGVITVPLTCNLSTACRGAFLLCVQDTGFCQGGSQVNTSGRLAGSDFVVPAGTMSDVPVALTTVGKQLASETGGFGALVLIDMLDYGIVFDSQSNNSTFNLTSTDPPTFPAGATAGCGQAVFVNSDTTCPFAQNVAQAYSKANSPGTGTTTVTAVSPVTGQAYTMQCTGQWPVACQGGTNALVEFYPFFS
jgi:hypothetical protein